MVDRYQSCSIARELMVFRPAEMGVTRGVERLCTLVALVPGADGSVFDPEAMKDGLTLWTHDLVEFSKCVVIGDFTTFEMFVQVRARYVVVEAFGAEIASAQLF